MADGIVFVFAEGPHEIGRRYGLPVPVDEELPALPRLVHRLLGEPKGVQFACHPLKNVGPVHGLGSKLAKKVIRAIRMADKQGAAGAIVAVDRDRRPDSERIVELRKGRDKALEDRSLNVSCAVGSPVEAFDAWMIADGKAMAAVGTPATPNPHASPESLAGKPGSDQHPKDHACTQLGGGAELGRAYAVIARQVDLSFLERACPQGFRPFADEVRANLWPLFGPAESGGAGHA